MQCLMQLIFVLIIVLMQLIIVWLFLNYFLVLKSFVAPSEVLLEISQMIVLEV